MTLTGGTTRRLAVVAAVVSLVCLATAGRASASDHSRTARATATVAAWPSGCNGTEVLDWTLGMKSVAHFWHCVSGGKTLTSANIIPCQITYCGHYPPTDSTPPNTTALDPWADPAAGGPSCQVVNHSFKMCANGSGNPWMVTAIEWNDPACAGGWCWHGVDRFAPDYSIHFWDHVKDVWHNHLLRKCTAQIIGTGVATAVVVVTVGGSVVVGIIMGITGGCVTGALNYWFGV